MIYRQGWRISKIIWLGLFLAEFSFGQTVYDVTGTCNLTSCRNLESRSFSVTLDWVADENGVVYAQITGFESVLMLVVFDPGTPAPADLYDLEINDVHGVDAIRDNGCACRDATTTYSWIPDATSGYHGFPMTGTYWLDISGAGSGGTGATKLSFE